MASSNGHISQPMVLDKNTGGEINDLAEQIAIVGMGCRWPGGASDPSSFWELLVNGHSANSTIPKERFNVDSFYHPNIHRPGSVIADGGYFLKEDPRNFEPGFFGITPAEAMSMDPTQRKLLEVAYESLESGGIRLEDISGSSTGCFVGNFNDDAVQIQARDAEYIPAYGATGTGVTIISNRVNYVFNLKGPSLTLDTACSSSMYALHLACMAIYNGDCDGALVAGTNLVQTAEPHIATSKLGTLSPTSQCHTFDEAADGYARADGIGALYIKRLSDAQRDNDPIRAIIKATSFNANGKTAGITHPSKEGQIKCMSMAYRRNHCDPSLTTYVEAHGTGTSVRDPIEVAAIGEFFGSCRPTGSPLLVGSVKTNIGHTEPSSGIASVMKTVLALEKGMIPPTIGIKKLNPRIDFAGLNVKVVVEPTPWPETDTQRQASINSFGYGGTNAHAVLLAYRPGKAPTDSDQRYNRAPDHKQLSIVPSRLLMVTARSKASLKLNTRSLLENVDRFPLTDLAYTLGLRRTHHPHRAYIIHPHSGPNVEPKFAMRMHKDPIVGLVFTGQGALGSDSAPSLLKGYPESLETIRILDTALQSLAQDSPKWLLEDAFYEGTDLSTTSVEIAQPLCTAIQICLVELLRSWNITPTVVVGHSSGEIAAAYASGRISASDAIITAYYRGKCVGEGPLNGAMLAVGLGPEDAMTYLANCGHRALTIACHNSPRSVTISGDADEIENLRLVLDSEKVFARKLETGGAAYHSPLMVDAGHAYIGSLPGTVSGSNFTTSHVLMYSTVTGEPINEELQAAQYWKENLQSPVLFDEAVRRLLGSADAPDVLIELGPHASLAGPLKDIGKLSLKRGQATPVILSAMKRGEECRHRLLSVAGELFNLGYGLDFTQINKIHEEKAKTPAVLVDLPTYSWNYTETFWRQSRLVSQWNHRGHQRHDLLGSLIPGSIEGQGSKALWRNILRLKDVPWLAGHKINNETIFPAAGYIAVAVEAFTQVAMFSGHSGDGGVSVSDVSISAALKIPDTDSGVEIITSINPTRNGGTRRSQTYNFSIVSVTEGKNIEHCNGLIGPVKGTLSSVPWNNDLENFQNSTSREAWYKAFADIGLGFGQSFRRLETIRIHPPSRRSIIDAIIESNSTVSGAQESRYMLHPTTIDACFQAGIISEYGQCHKLAHTTMPVSIEDISLWPADLSSSKVVIRTAASKSGMKNFYVNGEIQDLSQSTILKMKGMKVTKIPAAGLDRLSTRAPYLRLIAKPDITLLQEEDFKTLFPPLAPTFDQRIIEDMGLAVALIASDHTISESSQDVAHSKLAVVFSELMGMRKAELTIMFQDLMNPKSYELQILSRLFQYFLGQKAVEKYAFESVLIDFKQGYNDNSRFSAVGLNNFASIVDLLVHKDPKVRVLDICSGLETSRTVLTTLGGDSDFPRYKSYCIAQRNSIELAKLEQEFSAFKSIETRLLDLQLFVPGSYDIIILSNITQLPEDVPELLLKLRGLLKNGGKLVQLELTNFRAALPGTFPVFETILTNKSTSGSCVGPFHSKEMWKNFLLDAGFNTKVMLDDFSDSNQRQTVILSTAELQSVDACDQSPCTATELLILNDSDPTGLSNSLANIAQERYGLRVAQLNYRTTDFAVLPRCRTIVLAELAGSCISTLDEKKWYQFQSLFRNAASCLWVTDGKLLQGGQKCKPLLGMIHGIIRTLKTEMPRLALGSIDFESDLSEATYSDCCRLILTAERQLQESHGKTLDREFYERQHRLCVSRLVPDAELNLAFQNTYGLARPRDVRLGDLGPARLVCGRVGIMSSVYFAENITSPLDSVLADDEVEIKTKAVGMNMKDYVVLAGMFDSDTFSFECTGVITRTGRGVKDLQAGDRVLALCAGNYGTVQRTPSYMCHKVGVTDNLVDMATMPLVFCTALYALSHLVTLSSDDTVLIQSGAGGMGQAAIQVAKALKANIYVTVGSQAKKEFLQHRYDLSSENIIVSRELDIIEKLLEMTDGRGVDVILASSSGELFYELPRALAPLGKFIDLGRREVIENGRIPLSTFNTGCTFVSFDFRTVELTKPRLTQRLLGEMMSLYRQGIIKPLPKIVYGTSKVGDAFSDFGRGQHIGKIVVVYDDEETIKAVKAIPSANFDPHSSYLLVGGLGGLGRSLALWMASKGARSLVFLSRSGDASPNARNLLQNLKQLGVNFVVVKGDVCNRVDVSKAVVLAPSPIRGVIQGSMVLRDQLLDNMPLEDFKAGTRAKVQGTVNLHEVLIEAKQPLDFFVMTSSASGIVGTPTQANYNSANTFLDTFARYRRGLGLPATAISVGMVLDVGFIGEHPQAQVSLERQGLAGIKENEFLGMIDQAICQDQSAQDVSDGYDPESLAHIVTGFEDHQLARLTEKGFIGSASFTNDPKFSRIHANLDEVFDKITNGSYQETQIESEGNTGTEIHAKPVTFLQTFIHRLSVMLFIPPEDINPESSAMQYGIDSMVAADLRSWLYNAYNLDLSFLDFLNEGMSIGALAATISEHVNKSAGNR